MWLLGQEKKSMISLADSVQYASVTDSQTHDAVKFFCKNHCAVKFISPSAYLGHLTRKK